MKVSFLNNLEVKRQGHLLTAPLVSITKVFSLVSFCYISQVMIQMNNFFLTSSRALS
jgi:hypothetical protein